MTDPTTQPANLRDQIADVFTTWANARMTVCEHTQLIEFGAAADAALAVVQPALDQRDAEIARLKHERDELRDDIGEMSFLETAALGLADRFRTAWWSARIRAARLREQVECELCLRSEREEQRKLAERAEAAIARVRAVHPKETWAVDFGHVCGNCRDTSEDPMPWPCPTIAALDQPETRENEQ